MPDDEVADPPVAVVNVGSAHPDGGDSTRALMRAGRRDGPVLDLEAAVSVITLARMVPGLGCR